MTTYIPPRTDFTPIISEAPPLLPGERHQYRFPNGRGATVVRGPYSYGGDRGLWELAVLDSNGEYDPSTTVTSDVEGWLEDEDVNKLLHQINDLEGETNEEND